MLKKKVGKGCVAKLKPLRYLVKQFITFINQNITNIYNSCVLKRAIINIPFRSDEMQLMRIRIDSIV